MSCDDQFLIDELARIEAEIVAYHNAYTALMAGGVQSYTLDTSQTRQTVSKYEIASLKNTYNALMSIRDDLCARIYGASSYVRPAR